MRDGLVDGSSSWRSRPKRLLWSSAATSGCRRHLIGVGGFGAFRAVVIALLRAFRISRLWLAGRPPAVLHATLDADAFLAARPERPLRFVSVRTYASG